MLNVRLRMTLMVAGLGLGWTLIAPHAATAQCTYDVYPSSVDNVNHAGASGSLSVGWSHPPLPFDVDPLCGDSWFAVSNDPWISTRTSDTNNFTLHYTVAANPTAMARTGTITVSGHATFTIDQLAAPPCPSSPEVLPTSLTFTSDGGMKTVTVQEAAHCRYGVRGNPTSIGVRPANVVGDGSVTVTVDPNTGSSTLSGTVTIGGTTVPVDVPPPACTFQVEYTSREVADDPGQYDVSVTASASTCPWSMISHASWLEVRTPNRTGSTHGTYRTGDNIGSPQRDGTMTVAGHTVTITQRGSEPPRPCPDAPAVQPESVSLASAAEQSDQVTLQEAEICRYTVTETLDWIRVSPSTVAGNGVVTLTTETANDIATARSGTVSIGSTSVDVTQAGTTNSSPVAVNDSATTQTDTPVKIFVLANDTDADNDSLTVAAVVQAPAQGTAVVDTDRQTITYTPPTTDWTGTTTFRYRVSDGNGGTAEATVTVTVNPPNRPPTAHAHFVGSGAVGTIVTLDGTLSRDPDGDHLHYQWTQTDGKEVVLLNSTGDYAIAIEAELIFRVPATPGDDNLEFSLVVTDLRGAASEPATVTVTALGAVLTQHRERLLTDLASRGGRTGGVCALWNSLNRTKKEVFLWNTHRLHITRMLPDVTKLYAIYGADGAACGGGEYNRTFMAMTPALGDKLVLIARDQNGTVLPAWRETRDPACTWGVFIAAITGTSFRPECPHQPFTAQVETFKGSPRGQIQFFGPDYVVVSREYGPGGGFDSCGVDRIGVPRSDVCPAGTTCSGGGPYTGCTSEHSDTIVYDPTGPYTRGPAGDTVTITDALSFEMDQDYGTTHNSAPGCSNMRMTYSEEYGDPNWQWRPTGCSPPMGVTEPEPDPFGGRSIRAVHMTELRQRVNALRQRFSLAAYNWTDATITPEVTPAKAVHVTELRTALNEAYRAANRDAPDFTDAVITPRVTPIRQVHLNELRKAVVALER